MFFWIAAGVRYADQPSLWQGKLLAIAALLFLVLIPVLVVWARRRGARIRERRFYGGVTPIQPARLPPNHVRIVFHTYSGFLIFVDQRKHDAVVPIDDAKILLKRLVRHNLTWGLFAYGGVLVPIFTFFEYQSQMKKISAATQGFPVLEE